MASLNPLTRELVFKLVFYGPGLGGKTTSLQYIHGATKPENRGNLVSLATPTDRTIYFDFLPLRMQKIRDLGVRLQLFTVPGQVYYTATRKLVLTGADGVVFVADSQAPRMEANVESFEDLERNLAEHGKEISSFPLVFQWNKRDIDGAIPRSDLEARLNPKKRPSIETVATKGEGVFDTLEEITRLAIHAYLAELPAARPSGPSPTSRRDPGGLADAIRTLTEGGSLLRGNDSAKPAAVSIVPTGKTVARITRPAAPMPGEPPPTINPSPSQQPSAGLSMVDLFAPGDREAARAVERALVSKDASGAIDACDELLVRHLASVASLSGHSEAPRDPALACLLLGVDGKRFLRFRSLVRTARHGAEMSMTDALEYYAFVLEVRYARLAR